MGSIILLLLGEMEITLQPHRVLSITCDLHPLTSVTFKGILGKLRPFTVGVAKLCVSHKMGFSGGPNMMRDRRTYRTASDIFHQHNRRAQFHRTDGSLISASANLKPLPREQWDEPGGITSRDFSTHMHGRPPPMRAILRVMQFGQSRPPRGKISKATHICDDTTGE